jgi:Tfp pilus assembly protein PilW
MSLNFFNIKKIMRARQGPKGGLSLVEIVVYLGIVTILTVAVVNSIIGLVTIYQKIKVVRQLRQSAVVAMDRITREIRNASSVDVGNSVLNTNPGSLQLNTVTPSGTQTVKFTLTNTGVNNGVIRVLENGVDKGPLTSGRASTTNLIFRQITTPYSQAVKIEMTMVASSSKFIRTAKFYDTIILRGSY